MKHITLSLVLFFLLQSHFYGQEIVINAELLLQIQKNFSARQVSSDWQHNRITEADANYGRIETNLVEVLFVKEKIYQSLRNVEEGMKNGKQVAYIIDIAARAVEEFTELTSHNLIGSPDVLLLRNEYVSNYQQDAARHILEMNEEILKINNTYLMNYHDRQRSLDRIQRRVYQLYIRTKGFNIMIRNYARLDPLYRHTKLRSYINKDKAMFLRISNNIKRLGL